MFALPEVRIVKYPPRPATLTFYEGPQQVCELILKDAVIMFKVNAGTIDSERTRDRAWGAANVHTIP